MGVRVIILPLLEVVMHGERALGVVPNTDQTTGKYLLENRLRQLLGAVAHAPPLYAVPRQVVVAPRRRFIAFIVMATQRAAPIGYVTAHAAPFRVSE